jgi:NSS family neurotransmitter:Na+ symporter
MREHWGSRAGFVLAAVGSAVGLGNMWRFSYLTAEHGGGAFLVLYAGMVLLIGLPVMLAELTIGRAAGKSPMGALLQFGGRTWQPLGIFFVLVGVAILSYYNVIAGWTLRYALEALLQGFPDDPSAHFDRISAGSGAVGWHLLFMGITVAVVASGIRGGIERSVTVLIPLLFALLVGLALYAVTIPGGEAGYRFYLETDFQKIWSIDVLNAAAGQAFFSLSVGMGALMTYASYLTERDHLPNESLIIAGADFSVAFIAGLVVFPLLFGLGLSQEISGSTIGALFVVLPGAFQDMGGAGRVVGLLFFLALAVAALTSTISILEVIVATAMERLNWTRSRAALIAGGLVALCGIPAALDTDVLGRMDDIAANKCLPIGALALSLFVGWRMERPLEAVSVGAGGVRWFGLWVWLLRVPVPATLAFIVVMQFL